MKPLARLDGMFRKLSFRFLSRLSQFMPFPFTTFISTKIIPKRRTYFSCHVTIGEGLSLVGVFGAITGLILVLEILSATQDVKETLVNATQDVKETLVELRSEVVRVLRELQPSSSLQS